MAKYLKEITQDWNTFFAAFKGTFEKFYLRQDKTIFLWFGFRIGIFEIGRVFRQ